MERYLDQINPNTINPLTHPPNYGTPRFNIPSNLALRAPIPYSMMEHSIYGENDHLFMQTQAPMSFAPPQAYGVPPRSMLPPLGPRLQFPENMNSLHRYPFPFPDSDEITPENIEEYVELGVIKLNKTLEDEESVQRIIYQLITQGRLPLKMMTILRKNADSFSV